MKHGINTDFTNGFTDPCFIRVSSVAKCFCSLRMPPALVIRSDAHVRLESLTYYAAFLNNGRPIMR